MVEPTGGATTWVVFRGFIFVGRLIAEIFRGIKQSFYRRPMAHYLTPEYYYGPYLGAGAEKSSITHETTCVARLDELDEVIQSVDSGDISVLHISAPPGYGKSRFALELARNLQGKGRGFTWYLTRLIKRGLWKVSFVRQDTSNIVEYVDELRRNRRLAIFIDNAHEVSENVKALANYARLTEADGKILLICFSRSTLRNLVTDALDWLPTETVHDYSIKKLDKDAIKQIIEAQLPDQPESLKKQIVNFASDSVFLTVYVCQLVKREVDFSDAVSEEQFRRKLCDAPIAEAIAPCDIPLFKAMRATAVLSAAAPANHLADDIRNATCQLADISSVEYDCLVSQLVDSALFSTYAISILKPTPDLIGALMIDNACISGDTPNSFSSDLLKTLLPICPKQALDSLSDLGWTVGSSSSIDIVGPVIDAETKAIDSASPAACSRVMGVLAPLSVRRAVQVVGFVDVAWSKTLSVIAGNADNANEWKTVMGEATQLLAAAAHVESAMEPAIGLIKEMSIHEGVDTFYANHKPQTVLSELIGFATSRSVTQTAQMLSIVEHWFKSGGSDAVIALRSIGGLLSTTVHWTESDAFTVSWNTSALNLSEQVKDVRRRAMALVIRGITSPDTAIQREAFATASSIGQYRGSRPHGTDAEMAELIDSERSEVIESLSVLLLGDKTNALQIRTERLLWDWWRNGGDGLAEQCERLFHMFDDTGEYRISKYIYSENLPVSKIAGIVSSDEGATRSDRYFSDYRDDREASKENVTATLDEIGRQDDPSAWMAFFRALEDTDLEFGWRAGNVFEALAERHPNTAWEMIRTDDDIWSRYKASLLFGARLADRSRWETELSNVLSLPSLDPDLAYAWQQSIDWRSELLELDWRLIEKCNATGDVGVRRSLSGNVAHGSVIDWQRRCEYLLRMAQENPNDTNIIDNCFVLLSHSRPAELRSKLTQMDYDALDFLLVDGLDDYVPWDKPHWVGAFLELVAGLDDERFLNFVEQSFKSEDSVQRMHLRILGARNATKPFAKLLESGFKRTHVARFFRWAVEDNLLGEFAGSLISNGLALNDTEVVVHLERMYSAGAYQDLTRVLQYFKVDEDWLTEVNRVIIEVDKSCPEQFESIASTLSANYWAGSTTRTPGHPGPRDKLIADYFNARLEDKTLSPRVRQYFTERASAAEQSIERDLAEDERIAGRAL